VTITSSVSILNRRKEVFVGDAFHTFHPVGGQGLNTCWRDVNVIYDILNRELSTKNNEQLGSIYREEIPWKKQLSRGLLVSNSSLPKPTPIINKLEYEQQL